VVLIKYGFQVIGNGMEGNIYGKEGIVKGKEKTKFGLPDIGLKHQEDGNGHRGIGDKINSISF
jgi:hypothetical protein